LVFFGERYYQPEVGRWLTLDPAGHIDGPNGYAYLQSNPLYYDDFYGLWSWDGVKETITSFFSGPSSKEGSSQNDKSNITREPYSRLETALDYIDTAFTVAEIALICAPEPAVSKASALGLRVFHVGIRALRSVNFVRRCSLGHRGIKVVNSISKTTKISGKFLSKARKLIFKGKAPQKGVKLSKTEKVIHVTKEGVALPNSVKYDIPKTL